MHEARKHNYSMRSFKWMFVFAVVAFALSHACATVCASLDESGEAGETDVAMHEARALDAWEDEFERIESMVNETWSRREWQSESDQFARDMVIDVAKIPPWDCVKRVQVVSESLSKRYELDPMSSLRFQSMIVQHLGGFISNNSKTLAKQAEEWEQARANGEPITAEQVALWTAESEALIEEANYRVLKLAGDLKGMVPEDRRALLLEDMDGYHERIEYLREVRAAWSRGEWTPADWGLGGSRNTHDTLASTIILQPAEELEWVVHDPSTWRAYMRHFEKLHKLSTGQRGSARSIFAEIMVRSTRYAHIHQVELNLVPEEERSSSPTYATIRGLFAELRARLDAQLTCTQRGQSEE